jgi:type I restriction enzyme, S subunit
MGFKIIKTPISNIATDNELRFDFKFYTFYSENDWNLIKTNKKLISLGEILELNFQNYLFEEGEDYKGIPTGKEFINEYGIIISYQEITIDNKPNRLKYFAEKGSVIISSLRLARSTAFLIEEGEDKYVYSNGFYIFKINENWNKKFVEHILRSKKLKSIIDNNLYRGIGISSYKYNDLFKIKIPLIKIEEQNKIVERIFPIEKEMKSLIFSQRSEADIINEVFTEELRLNIEEFNKVKNIKIFKTPFNDFSENIDLRYSEKFHHPAHKYIIDFMATKTNKRIKDFVSQPIVLGKTISPKQYKEDTDCHYLSMATIKSWYFDSSEAQCVSKDYENDNLDKKVALNDIVIARSGEGSIGKVALIDNEDTNAVFADFTMRVRLDNYNCEFAYYYFRSMFFQLLVEYNKKGLGNNTNIFPSQIGEFPMLDYSLKDQAKIVEKIKTRILDQQKYTQMIEAKRAEIEKLILDSLSA